MSQYVFKMPDLGEGTVEAEIVAWHTSPGADVKEDQVIVEVMTDKAAVEVPAPVTGRVVSISGVPGDKIAVGSPLIVFETAPNAASPAAPSAPAQTSAAAAQVSAIPTQTSGAPASAPAAASAAATRGAAPVAPMAAAAASGGSDTPAVATASIAKTATLAASTSGSAARAPTGGATRVMTSPANRRRAHEAGIDLATIAGSGPGGRILREDVMAATRVEAAVPASPRAAASPAGAAQTTEIKVIGLRRVIAERMSEAKRNIPHFAYVEEVDVTELESLRQHLNAKLPKGEATYTFLPLVIAALVRTLEAFPQCNVLYDAARGVLVRHAAVHVGVATQTPDGLKVPVVRNAQALALPALAAEIRRVTERARTNKASRDELMGSTITITSLGKLGGIVSTPIINAPEVAIIGLNKAVERPVVHEGAVAIRRIMNLSSSFDHRFVDGYDAAAMIQALKELLEHPAMIFITR
jgi:2-oxoisovalerate dehydrogenase E2 component (dihydrolipoyl transacylase)